MDSRALNDKHLIDWDEDDVQQWFAHLGYPQYERELKENNIRGDTLCLLDAEALTSLGIKTVGQRLSILKSIYNLKVAHGVPLNEDDYIPPSLSTDDHPSLEVIHADVKDQGMSISDSNRSMISLKSFGLPANRIRILEENNRLLALSMQSFLEEIAKFRSSVGLSDDETPKVTQKRVPFFENETYQTDRSSRFTEEKGHTESPQTSSESAPVAHKLPTPPTAENVPYPKLSLEDPTWKVLPAALKKHKIPPTLWQDYAMLISYGPSGNRAKRRLDPEEKPLHLFKKLKEAGHNPAFVLKNLKEKDPGPPGSVSEIERERTPSPTPPGIVGQGQRSLYPSPPPSRSTSRPLIDPFQ